MSSRSPHRRWNPLKEEWVLVSPQRGARPWHGAIEKITAQKIAAHDPDCQLCPGSARANGVKNPDYKGTFAFDNDFPALVEPDQLGGDPTRSELNGIVLAEATSGSCRVICYSERHDLTLAQMERGAIEAVLRLWREEYKTLAQKKFIKHVMIFENKGQVMGCSNPHPHGQIWATSHVPNIPLAGANAQKKYFTAHNRSLLGDYLEWELKEKERVVFDNGEWVAVVPFWAVWPYETMLIPKRHVAAASDLDGAMLASWAEALRELTIRYDNLFECSFPYSMALYQPPTDGGAWPGFRLHQIFFPPLLRSATVKKFMVGFELSAEAQRDITAEGAAEKLRALPVKRFS